MSDHTHMGWHRGGDLTVLFGCRMIRDHYGVPGSPTWLAPDPDSVRVLSAELLGCELDMDGLQTDAADAIRDLADGVRWEAEPEKGSPHE